MGRFWGSLGSAAAALAVCAGCGEVDSDAEEAPAIAPQSAPASVAAGAQHTCAVRKNGAVACWGDGTRGQLGNGEEAARLERRDVAGLDVRVHALAAGGATTCVLDDSGSVWCWGSLNAVQGGSSDGYGYPKEVEGLHHRAEQLSVGEDHACVVTHAGDVECWGEGARGALTGSNRDSSGVPVRVPDVPKAIQVTASAGFSCALTEAAEVYCWGLGMAEEPELVAQQWGPWKIQFAGPVVRLAEASGGRPCAVPEGGGLMCWGERENFPLSRVPQEEPAGVRAKLGAVGTHHNCVIRTDQSVWCWPEMFSFHSGLGPAREVTVGADHICARDSQYLWCWGDNSKGQAGVDGPSEQPVIILLD